MDVAQIIREIGNPTGVRVYGQVVVVPKYVNGTDAAFHRNPANRLVYIAIEKAQAQQYETFGTGFGLMFDGPVVLFGVVGNTSQLSFYFPTFVLEEDNTLWNLFCSANSSLITVSVMPLDNLIKWFGL